MSLSEDLFRLSELHASGALSVDEYNRAKQQLLDSTPVTTAPALPPAPVPTPAPAYQTPAHQAPPTYAVPPSPQYGAPFQPPVQPWNGHNGPPATSRDAWLDPHYQHKFARIDAEGGSFVALWNWPAFLFGAFWYLFKGMWAKALLIFFVALLSGGLLGIPLWIYTGVAGTYDYYLLKRRQKQLW